MSAFRKTDRLFLATTLLLVLAGFFIFASASLGLLRRGGPAFSFVFVKQLLVLIAGLTSLFLISRINFRIWQRLSLILFIFSLILSALVFMPGLGLESGGARRWLNLGPFTVQPSEFLKLGFVLYGATLLAKGENRIRSLTRGILPLLLLLGLAGIILVAEPDIDTLIIIISAGLAMLFVGGARWSHLALIAILIVSGLGILSVYKPYLLNRLKTFLNPDEETLTISYQINQSLIAIGSGGIAGRGFGQSLQKFKYLPEPTSDSIFAVAGEEFGFIGGVTIISFFLVFMLSGLRIAARSPNQFGRLICVGIVIMIVANAFIHIASMLGLVPLSGTPLAFVSHGGSALFLSLVASGMVLNVSRYKRS